MCASDCRHFAYLFFYLFFAFGRGLLEYILDDFERLWRLQGRRREVTKRRRKEMGLLDFFVVG